MPSDLPIACTLTADEMPNRLAEMAELGRVALLSVQRHDARAILRFQPSSNSRARLERLVVAEGECCPFLDLDVRDEPDALWLTIAAPSGGETVLHQLV